MANDAVEQIKEKLPIEEVVAPYVKLKRAGRSMTGLCPFHKEKTPSFHVSTERNTWHCFGCGLGGDAFSFIEKAEGVDFKGALKILAERAGVPLVYDGASREAASKKDRLREAMARAGQWYATQLPGSPAEAYAHERGLTDETIKAWGLGFAPDGWRGLFETLGGEGFTTQELLAAGLIKEADGKPGTYYDRFRNRLMFPIRDTAGRVVAFTGRALSSDEQAKYLNSPETDLYRKSQVLFGMDRAKNAIRTRGFTMLVEGQMDVLHSHQAGFENAIALSGTALTGEHLALMKRYSGNLMLVLDADAAGLKATARSAMLALKEGVRVKAARLPKGKDPADLILEDKKAFTERIAAGKPVVEFFLAELSEQENDEHRLLRRAEEIVLPLIAAVPSPMERDHFIQSAARTLGLSSEAVRESLGSVRVQIDQPLSMTARTSGEPEAQTPPRSIREKYAEQLVALVHVYPGTPLAERIKTRYGEVTEAPQAFSDVPPEAVLFEIERSYGETPGDDAADELLDAFEIAVVREAYQEAVKELRKAEALGDASLIERAQQACADLSRRLASIGS